MAITWPYYKYLVESLEDTTIIIDCEDIKEVEYRIIPPKKTCSAKEAGVEPRFEILPASKGTLETRIPKNYLNSSVLQQFRLMKSNNFNIDIHDERKEDTS